ncbi:MAG: glycine cleavage system aminomethyltransferase GcvT [Deltaproteobacteria bacterium]|nr:glycine cleavage system aminomethyltransferase GcvT [Deltaproteobacteria bacterium]
MTELKRTALFEEHKKLGARMVPFAGWSMPVQYSQVIEEHLQVRSCAGLFDVSHMGEFEVKGKGAQKFLQSMLTNNIEKGEQGQAIYTIMCYENGGSVDDLIVYKINDEHFWLCVNASNIEKDFKWLEKHRPQNVIFTDISSEISLLALQGPNSEVILELYCKSQNIPFPTLKPFRFSVIKNKTFDGMIAHTGYTGEKGYELFIKNGLAVELWKNLLKIGGNYGIKPIGLGARDTLRLEMGYPLYGHELNQDITPLEAGLHFFVKLDKGPFIGCEKLLDQKQNGCSKYLVPLELMEKGIAREGYTIFSEDKKEIGKISSGTYSPLLKKSIALGFVKSNYKSDENFLIDIRGKWIKARKINLPFYRK